MTLPQSMTKSPTDFKEHMKRLERNLAMSAVTILQLGLLPDDEAHCLKVLLDLQHDVEKMTGMY